MTKDLVDHPSREQLIAFSAGRLESGDQQRIEQHVSGCDQCCEVLKDEPEDTLIERLRDADTLLKKSVGSKLPAHTPPAEHEIPPPLRDHARYRIIRRVGRGGMGVVYHAEHRLMDRPVALKVINQEYMDDAEAVVRFRTEVKAAARLDHPNIVRAYDAEQADDLHFLVMEFVSGVSLAQLVHKRGPMATSQACIVARKIAFGLQHASQQGMVHRDVKPQNVMVTRGGQVKILDFGLARLARQHDDEERRTDAERPQHSESALTQVGSVLGTPDYMAPEQADDSHKVDVRADVYSLGCTLYFLLAGRPPFPKGTALEKLLSHREREPQPLTDIRADVSPALGRTIQKMLAKRPDDRHQTPADVAEALAPFTKSSASSAGNSEKPMALADVVASVEELAADDLSPTELDDHRPPKRRAGRRRSSDKKRSSASRRRRNVIIACGTLAMAGVALLLTLSGFFGNANSKKSSAVPRILMVLPHDGFWNPDYEPVRQALEENGARVSVASSARTPAQPHPEYGDERPVTPDLLLSEAKTADYDVVIFTGQRVKVGKTNEFLGDSIHARAAKKFMREMLATGKFVTSVCGGTAVLVDAGVLSGHRAAHNGFLKDAIDPDLVNRCGAKWEYSEPVVVDGRLITAKSWNDAKLFVRTLLGKLAEPR